MAAIFQQLLEEDKKKARGLAKEYSYTRDGLSIFCTWRQSREYTIKDYITNI
jgi:hypothetical protein